MSDQSSTIVPDGVADQCLDLLRAELPFPRPKYPPLNRRQRLTRRLRVWLYEVRWWLHDRLFHDCYP